MEPPRNPEEKEKMERALIWEKSELNEFAIN